MKATVRTINMAAITNGGGTEKNYSGNRLRCMVCNWGNFDSPPGDLWQCLEIFLFSQLGVCATST